MALDISVRRMEMPKGGKPPVNLMGFDYGEHLFHVLAFDFGDDGGAIGIWREGGQFCARLSLDSLAEFWYRAERGIDTIEPGRALHTAVLDAIEGLMGKDLPNDSPPGIAFERLVVAVEAYEKATLPPPFGNAVIPSIGTAPSNDGEQR